MDIEVGKDNIRTIVFKVEDDSTSPFIVCPTFNSRHLYR